MKSFLFVYRDTKWIIYICSRTEHTMIQIRIDMDFHVFLKLGSLNLVSFKNYEKCFLFHLKSSSSSRDIQFFVFLSFPYFLAVGHCFRGWSKINLKVHVINYLNKNSITHFFYILGRKKGMTMKCCHAENVQQKLVPDLFIILVNTLKQPFHESNYFKSKIFWKRIIKKP